MRPGCHLFWAVPNLSHEKRVQVKALLCLRDFLRTPLTVLEGLAIGFPMLHRRPSFDCCFELLVDRASFLVPHRHFALLLDLKMYLTSPAVAMF